MKVPLVRLCCFTVPLKYIGVGEKLEDLQKFDAEAFVNALFDAEQELKLE